jgi:hypothetical protein
MSLSKQLAMNFSVNGKNLPIEVIDIIKSFAFEDKIVGLAKKVMKQLLKKINSAVIHDYINGSSASWEFRIHDERHPLFLSIKNTNCTLCGEFEREFHSNCVCKCIMDEDYYENDEYYDDPWYWQY